MHLYNLTLSRSSGIQCAIYGTFSAPKQQEVVVSRGKVIELLRGDENGKMQVIVSTDVFGCIRSMIPFRLTGATQDHIIVGSDSGRIVILKYDKETEGFVKVHQETFGRSGCRRIVPGQFLAADPHGRACMIASLEKQKLVYVLNRDASAALTISSPLEAHKAHHITFAIAALDCGFDNPTFAAIELDYTDADADPTGEAASEAEKHLTFYSLDLGTNHVVRKWSEGVDNGANLLIPVPGGKDGPGGVLVCAENFVIYKNQGHPDVRAVVPRREDLPGDRGVLLVSFGAHKHKRDFFFLAQSEYGDIYKLTLDYGNVPGVGEQVTELRVRYFDTIPPCVSMCVLKSGFLFAASEFGNHVLYQFQSLGTEEGDVEASSSTLVETDEGFQPVFFSPRPLQNLALIDEMESLCPLTDMKVANLLEEETPQIYGLCGRGARSSLRVLRPGLAVQEMAVSGLPGVPTAVWTVKHAATDDYDAYIIVSFQNATLVLSIGDTVEEVSDSGFLATMNTLTVQLLADNSILQVHPQGLRHIRTDKRINEWKAPGRRTIVQAASNSQQVVVSLSGGELVYFELDAQGQLGEAEKRELAGDVACLDIAPVPEGRQRSRFLAVGSYDSTVRILSLDPNECLKVAATQALTAPPCALLLLDMMPEGDAAPTGASAGMFLQVGLSNGVLVRNEVDRITGKLSDSRTRFLGTKAPLLFPLRVRGQRAMLALSSRPWLGYSDRGRFVLTPLTYERLDHAASFASDQCPEGFVAVAGNTLRVLALDRLGAMFNQAAVRLRYTPRKMVIHPDYNRLIIAEADHAAIPAAEREALPPQEPAVDPDTGEPAGPLTEEERRSALDEQFGAPVGSEGQWASCLRVVDPATLQSSCLLELDGNEAAISLCLVTFSSQHTAGAMLAVGTVAGMRFNPRAVEGGFIHIYQVSPEGAALQLLHKTAVGGIPAALTAFQGKLLAGVGTAVRLYECGKKKLLRKCEHAGLPTQVISLAALGDRIYVGDVQESFHYMKYKSEDNQLYIYADDVAPRYLTSSLQLDYDTMCGGDKFGNLLVARLPPSASEEVEEDPTGGKFAGVTGQLNGAAHKLEAIVQFHVGETVTALQRAAMQPGGLEVILYSTLMGAVGVLCPFTSKQDTDFFATLEMHMRQENPPLCGRDHLAYRSAYFPVKNMVDGDLCEQFPTLDPELQQRIATDLDRTVGEVLKKLEDMRNRII